VKRHLALAVTFLVCTAVAGHTRAAVSLQFVSPAADMYVTGVTDLQVAIRGAANDAVEDVTFFADGRQVCVASGDKAGCRWDAGAAVVEHVLRAVARLKSGERLVANMRTKGLGYTESVSVEVVQLNVVVTDGGKFVSGLSRDQFRVLDDKESRALTTFEAYGAPLELVLALDVSGSMANALPDIKTAAATFLQSLGPSDQVTIVAFNDNMFTLARREADKEARLKAIDRLNAWGGTSLYDVIERSLELLSHQQGRRALVVFTDGDDRSSEATFDDVQKRVSDSDATLFAVGLGRGAKVKELQDKLEQLAEASGGQALFAERADKLNEPFGAILKDLTNQYMLAFEPSRDGKYHRITVQIPGKGYKVRTRLGYTASVSK